MSVLTEPRAWILPAADLDRRFYAFAIDRLVAWPIAAAAWWAAHHFLLSEGRIGAGAAVVVAVVVLMGLGFAIPVALFGVTPGKAVLGLRVVHHDTGEPIGLMPSLVRSLLLGTCALPTFGLGLAILAWTAVTDPGRRRRGWHDQVSGSVVVDVRPVAVVEEPVEEAPREMVNLTAMRLVPAPARPELVPAARPSPTSGPAGGALERMPRWRIAFDTGEELLVEGVGLVGRRPEPWPDEPVRHLVPLRSSDMSLSKTHAQLEVARDGVLVVTDRGSTNGSVLVRSGVARDLPPGRPTTLLPGDVVQFGDRQMTVARES